jgi:hypothetical protein
MNDIAMWARALVTVAAAATVETLHGIARMAVLLLASTIAARIRGLEP